MDILSVTDVFWPLGYWTESKQCPVCFRRWVQVTPLGITGQECPYCAYEEPAVEHLQPGDGLWIVDDPYRDIRWPKESSDALQAE